MREHLSYDDHLREKLADEEYARGYLQVALEEAEADGNYAGFLMALRRVVEVRGGMTEVSRATSLNRTSLYKALAEDGNPRLETLGAVLHSLGMKLSLTVAIDGKVALL